MSKWVYKSRLNFPGAAAMMFLTEHRDCLTREFAVVRVDEVSDLYGLFSMADAECMAVNRYCVNTARQAFWVHRYIESKEEAEIAQKIRDFYNLGEEIDTLDDLQAQERGE